MISTLGRTARSLAVASLVVAAALAQQASPRPPLYVVKDVRIEPRDDAPHVNLVLRDGRIERIAKLDEAPPLGARELEGKGMLVVPAFVDAFTQEGCETPTPVADKDQPPSEASDVQVDMRDANRKGIQPAFRASQVFALAKDKSKALREAGFGAVVSAPTGQLLAGTSTLATTRDAAARDTILAPDVFAHAAFRASGGGYPSTLMGYHAQLRQFFLDAARHATLLRRYQEGQSGPRPAFDVELEAGVKLLDKSQRLMCEAQSAQDILRWIKFGDELGVSVGIVGGREAWKVADVLKARSIPVVLTLDWGDEPKDPAEKDKKGGKKDGAKAAPKKDAAAEGASKPEAASVEAAKPEAAQSEDAKPDEAKPGDAKKAEDILRKASNTHGVPAKLQENLALVVGLQGRYDESKSIAAVASDPASAAENADYLRRMVKVESKPEASSASVAVARNAPVTFKPSTADKPSEASASWQTQVARSDVW